jgi:hypothetical protein
LWVLISELDYGHRDESSIRHELDSSLRAARTAHSAPRRMRVDPQDSRNRSGSRARRPRQGQSGA